MVIAWKTGAALAALTAGAALAACDVVADIPERSVNPRITCDTGVCACAEGYADCDGNRDNGCEVVLADDAHHCGDCGHDCVGGACQGGMCQPVVVEGFSYPAALGMIQGSLFVTGCGASALVKADVAGGAVTRLYKASDTTCGTLLAVAGDSVYWASLDLTGIFGSSEAIYRSSAVTPGAPKNIALTGSPPTYLAAGGGAVYWVEGTSPATQYVYRVPASGGSQVTIATIPLGPLLGLVADDQKAYWTDGYAINAVAHDGTTTAVFAKGGYQTLAIDADDLYANDSSGTLWKFPLAGGARVRLGQVENGDNDVSITMLAVDEQRIYWLNSRFELRYLPLGGWPPNILAGGQVITPGTGFATEAEAAYWVMAYQVHKVAK